VRVFFEPVLAQRTTLRLGGKAIAEIILEKEQDVHVLEEELHKLGGEVLVLGEGSNILANDDQLSLVLVRLDGNRQVEVVHSTEKEVFILVPAEMRLARLLGWCRAHGLSGLEELTGIPGSLGGAVAMNAGSYGLEMGQVLDRVLMWTPTRGCIWREPGEWRSGYRCFDAGLHDKPELILAAQLRLRPDSREVIRNRMQQWYARKKQTQPVTMASAGCVFKNPSPEQPAGKLLDHIGLRGYRLGQMAFSDRHANFMVNLGGGRAKEAFELLHLAKQRAWSFFGVELVEEVRIIS
jgi:UDP-N-acetylmuramate dehydrogenase